MYQLPLIHNSTNHFPESIQHVHSNIKLTLRNLALKLIHLSISCTCCQVASGQYCTSYAWGVSHYTGDFWGQSCSALSTALAGQHMVCPHLYMYVLLLHPKHEVSQWACTAVLLQNIVIMFLHVYHQNCTCISR